MSESRSVRRAAFRRLCDLADVKGLRVGIRAGRVRGTGVEQYRELDSIVLSTATPGEGEAREKIHKSIDAAARRLLEVIT